MTAAKFVLQAAGFFLQVYPIAMLSFIPFSQKNLLFSRKIIYIFLSAALISASLGFAVLYKIIYSPLGGHNQLLRTVSNLYMCGFLVLYITGYFLIVHTETIKKILILVLLIHYEAILYTTISVINGILSHFKDNNFFIIYDTTDILISFLLLLVTCPIVFLFLKHIVQPCLPIMANRILRRGCIYLLIILLLFAVCVFTLTNFYFYYGITKYPIILFLLAFTLTDVIVYYIFFTEVRIYSENQILENQLRNFDENYQKISTSIAEARRARHDLRHHLDMISTLYHQGKDSELEEYLNQYRNFTAELNETRLSGYPALDNLLNFYIQKAQGDGISVTSDIQPFRQNLGFDIIDLTVLIGNIMENAVEACHNLQSEQTSPYIRIWIRLSEFFLLIKIENSCSRNGPKTLDYTDGTEFVSTKHVSLSGQGLKSIRYVAEKYGGSAEFKKSDGTFSTRIVLNIP